MNLGKLLQKKTPGLRSSKEIFEKPKETGAFP